MNNIQSSKALSAEKLGLLELMLKKKGISMQTSRGIPRRTDAGPCPLSFGQQRLWFLDQLEPDNPVYNIPAAIRLNGSLNVDALVHSLNELVRRHEVLRTTFTIVDGHPAQVIHEAKPLPLPIVDLQKLSADEREARALQLVAVEARKPFNISSEPPIRAQLLRMDENDHVILVSMHHIASDLFSRMILVREIAALYQAYDQNMPSPLAELPIQYADYALWQRQWLQGEVLERQLRYWKNQLDGAAAVLELPTDRPRPPVQSYRGASLPFTPSIELARALKDLARAEGVTLFMLLMAAFQTLLFRYCGQRQISVGTPVAGRTRRETEGLIGFFINTLVLRTDFSGDPTFRQLLQRVKEVALGAFAHQDVPFEKLVEELNVERSLSHTPLFQVMLDLQTLQPDDFQLSGLTLTPLAPEQPTAKFDLNFDIVDANDTLTGVLEYSTDLFDSETIARMLAHFEQLLSEVVAHPQRRISSLRLLSEAERTQMLVEWNNTEADYPRHLTMAQLFEQQVERTPQAIAVNEKDRALTYAELNQRADRLARLLIEEGIDTEAVVPLLMNRQIDLLTMILAVFKVGAAYLPLDPLHPPQRLRQIIARSGAGLIVAAGEFMPKLEEALSDIEAPRLLALEELLEREAAAENLDRSSDPANLAYLIYTSGSTGVPKGVMIEQQGMINHLFAKIRDLQLSGDDVVAQTASQCFDISVWQFLAVLLVGGRVSIFDDETTHDPGQLLAQVDQERITILEVVPSMLRAMLAEANRTASRFSTVRYLLATGEALAPELARQWLLSQPEIPLINAYGPTECSDDVTHHLLTTPPPVEATRIPIGRPVSNTKLYVLDRKLNPMPVGVPGELFVGGDGVGRGYWREASVTAQSFIPDPFAGREGARLYRTGDLAQYQPDGTIDFLGRMDQQVKVRGFRIELGEIEALLSSHPSVREAVVIADEVEGIETRLVAYVVYEEQPTADLREFLKEQLPEYMVPSLVIGLDRMPLGPNGKLDRRALPSPAAKLQEQVDRKHERPRTATEEVIAAVWSEVLRVERVGRRDNFFDLGGHSLMATQVITRLREAFSLELPLRTIFERPTVIGLAERVDEELKRTGGVIEELPPVTRVDREGTLPLSFAQRRLWFLDQLEPGSAFYNVPAVFRVSGPLDVMLLHDVLREVVSRHETLRTTFTALNGEPVAVIHPTGAVDLPLVDLSDLSPADRESKARELVSTEVRTPFDLARGPLMRVRVFRLEQEEHVVVITMHHTISDGWSIGILIEEIVKLYGAFADGGSSPLGELPIQYVDFAAWQQQRLQGTELESQLQYWKQQLHGPLPVLELSTDHPRPAVQTFRGARHSHIFSARLSNALRDLSRRRGVTLYMTLLAAYQTLLHRYTGAEDICVGSPIANRPLRETEQLIGCFLNTLVMRTDLSGDPTFTELLQRVREVTLEAYAHQEVPFEKIVDALQPERAMDHSPLFQVTFSLLNTPAVRMETVQDLTLTSVESDTATAQFDLLLLMADGEEELAATFVYNTDLFEAASIARLVGHFETLLESIVNTPEEKLSALEILDEIDRRELLVDLNQTADYFPSDATINQFIEGQAQRTPGATAVTFAGQSLTYEELNRRANQLAHYLRAAGIGPETCVGLCVERSLEMVVGILGILKAGGAYVPLDPAYPQERLALMLADTGAPVLLTQKHLVDGIEATGIEVTCLDSDWEKIAQESEADPPPFAGPQNLAYVIFTSGSTGRPKGVLVTHRNLVHSTYTRFRFYDESVSCFLLLSSFSFDSSIAGIFWTLCQGGNLCLPGEGDQMDMARLADLIERHRVSHLLCLPSLYSLLLNQTQAAQLASLRCAIVAGEACHRDLSDLHHQLLPQAALYNEYGPTEGTVWSSAYRSNAGDEYLQMPMGRPIANTSLFLLDREMRPVPFGVPGELYVGGEGITRGYLHRPELTAERFVPDPFREEPGSRLYKTGDLVRYLHDGNLEFLGRADDQVKLRGYRIELGEVTSVLRQHEDVDEAVVIVREDQPGDKRLVAYVVQSTPANGSELSATALRRFMRERLPDYMVPSAFEILEQLPLLPNGKVDRRALAVPAYVAAESEVAYVPPGTELERLLTTIWSDVLKRDQIGIHDNFFDLGGHSFLAIKAHYQLVQQLKREIPLLRMFEYPTVHTLAKFLGENSGPQIEAEQSDDWAQKRRNALQRQRAARRS